MSALRTIPVAEILEAVAQVRADGWKVARGLWFDRDKSGSRCCPLGACLIERGALDDRPDHEYDYNNIAAELNIDASWAEGFAHGFDGNVVRPSRQAHADRYDLGYAAGAECLAKLSPERA